MTINQDTINQSLPSISTHPVEEQSEVFGREAVEGAGREDVEEAQLQVLQRLLLTRHHPAEQDRERSSPSILLNLVAQDFGDNKHCARRTNRQDAKLVQGGPSGRELGFG